MTGSRGPDPARARLEPSPLDGAIGQGEAARLGALLIGSASVVGAVVTAIVTADGGGHRDFRPMMVWVTIGLGLAVAIGLLHAPGVLTPRVTPLLFAGSTVGVTVIGFAAGASQAPYATMFYLWVGAAFILLPARSALVQVLLVGVAHGVLLALQPGNPNPLAAWEFTFGVTLVTALVVQRVVTMLVSLAAGERQARTEAERVNLALEELSFRKTNFLARMSHEVRTPLNAIIGFADMLGDGLVGELNPQQADYVGEVRNSGRHLLDLIGDVLDLAKVEAGREHFDLDWFSLDAILSGAVVLFRPEAERRGITIELAVGPPIGSIRGDARKVRQVVLNLLSNAVKFTPPQGTVVVSAVLVAGRVRVAVADTGPGIAPDDIERIFEEYRQTTSGAAQGAGTGLGLPLARRFAQQHGGALDVVSRPGEGSVFTLTMPVAGPGAPAGAAPSRRPAPVAPVLAATPLDTPELRSHMALFPAVLGATASAFGGLSVVIEVVGGPPPGYRPLPLVALCAVAVALSLVLYVRRGSLTSGQLTAAIAVATVGFTAANYFIAAPNQPYGAMLFAWVAIGAVALLPRRSAAIEVLFVACCYGALMVVQRGNSDPLARWLIVTDLVATTAAAVDWLFTRVTDAAVREREARVRLELARQDLQEASRNKSDFLATMSHELRTPLNAIIGFSEVLADQLFGPLTVKQAEYMTDLTAAGRQLLALVNDILDLAKVEAGRMDLDIEDVDVRGALEAACAERHPGGPVELSAGDLPVIRADERKFQRIVGNLVGEELASPGAGRVTVSGSVDDDFLVVDVRRSGHARPRTSPRLPGGGGRPPLGSRSLSAFAELQGGRIDLQEDGWRLSLPLAEAAHPAGAGETREVV